MVFFQLFLAQLAFSNAEICNEKATSITEFTDNSIEVEYRPGIHKHIEFKYTRNCDSLNLLLDTYGESSIQCETAIDLQSIILEYSPKDLVEIIVEKVRRDSLFLLVKPYMNTKGKIDVNFNFTLTETEITLTGHYCEENTCETPCKDTVLTTASTKKMYRVNMKLKPSLSRSRISTLWLYVVLALMFLLVGVIFFIWKRIKGSWIMKGQNRRILYGAITQDAHARPSISSDRQLSTPS